MSLDRVLIVATFVLVLLLFLGVDLDVNSGR